MNQRKKDDAKGSQAIQSTGNRTRGSNYVTLAVLWSFAALGGGFEEKKDWREEEREFI